VATRVITKLVSDLSGKEIADGEGETVEFSYRGRSFAIDLTSAETAKFDSAMAKYLEHARAVVGTARRRPSSAPGADGKSIRAWARETGLQIPERGRIPAEVRKQYQAVH
jgi:nucleoid-associated protein Lsr2